MIETGRRLIDEFIEFISNLDKVGIVPVIEAPTGYGKSVSAPLIAAENYRKSFSTNFIHVLPLRAIVEDLYLCKYLYALSRNVTSCKSGPPKLFYEALELMDIRSEDNVAYQMGFDYMLKGIGVKEPTYDAKIVISTLDSLALNFLRIPVTEVYREIKHYAIPRARIFTATVFLDEAHMINRFEDESSGKMLSFLKILIEFSLKTETPLIIASATLWNNFRRKILSWSDNKAVFFIVSKEDGKQGPVIYVRDRDFEDYAKSIKWRTSIIDEVDLVSKVMEHVEKGEKILIVRDSIEDAINLYTALPLNEDEKALIHGRMCLEDREKALELSAKAKVVIATPVVEAGVDWDFDVGFRDATNIPSIVQVFGRVCRSRRNCEGSVYLIVKHDKVSNDIAKIIEFVRNSKVINWRIPYSYVSDRGEEIRGYQELLELTSSDLREDTKAENIFKWLIYPTVIPSSYINTIFREYGRLGGILREPLTQFYVYGKQGLENAKMVQDIISGTLSYSLNLVYRFRSCIEGVACVAESDSGIYVHYPQPRKKNYVDVFELQYECSKFASDVKGRTVFSGFIVERSCYKKGIGLL
jgi:CRISPR-associated endonuclease/helicase Cas3